MLIPPTAEMAQIATRTSICQQFLTLASQLCPGYTAFAPFPLESLDSTLHFGASRANMTPVFGGQAFSPPLDTQPVQVGVAGGSASSTWRGPPPRFGIWTPTSGQLDGSVMHISQMRYIFLAKFHFLPGG